MRTRRLGSTGLDVSRLALGTMSWGRDTDADAAAGQLEAFVGAGGTLIDTSNIYGDGDAESIIGTLIPDVIGRDQVVLSTTTVGVGSGRGALQRSLDASLRRLATDRVDLWQIHGFDDSVPVQETVGALEWALDSGRAAYVGLSGQSAWQVAGTAATLAARGRALASAQHEFSLVERSAESELVPAARRHGLGVLGWAPLGRGVLTGKYRHGTPADSRGASPHYARYVGRHRTDLAGRIVEAVATAADGLGTSPLAVALAWARDAPGITSAVVGAKDPAQLLGVLGAEELELPDEIRVALEDVSDPRADDDFVDVSAPLDDSPDLDGPSGPPVS